MLRAAVSRALKLRAGADLLVAETWDVHLPPYASPHRLYWRRDVAVPYACLQNKEKLTSLYPRD